MKKKIGPMISKGIKRKATEDLSGKPSKILHSVFRQIIGNMFTITARHINYIRNIYCHNLKNQTLLPKSLS